MAISAAFLVNGAANPATHLVDYGATVNLSLVSLNGINSVEWSVESVSKSGVAVPTVTPAGSPLGATASFSFVANPGDGSGRACLVKCKVIGARGESAVSYGVCGVANSQGRVPICPGEYAYRHETHGWIEVINDALNATVGGGGGSDSNPYLKNPVRAATATTLPAYTYSANVCTANANGAFPTVDGLTITSGQRILLKDGSSGAHNGIYTLTNAGSAGTRWTLTRATDFDASAEVLSGSIIPVGGGGTVNGGKIFVLSAQDPITLATTSLTFATRAGIPNGTSAGSVFVWNGSAHEGRGAKSGTDLTGSTQTIHVSNGSRYTLRDSVAGGNYTLTIGTAGATAGRILILEIYDTTRVITIANGGAMSGQQIFQKTAGTPRQYIAKFDGDNWINLGEIELDPIGTVS